MLFSTVATTVCIPPTVHESSLYSTSLSILAVFIFIDSNFFFNEVSVQIFCLFLMNFLIFSCKSSTYTLDPSSLSDMCFAKIFFRSVLVLLSF